MNILTSLPVNPPTSGRRVLFVWTLEAGHSEAHEEVFVIHHTAMMEVKTSIQSVKQKIETFVHKLIIYLYDLLIHVDQATCMGL